MSKYTSEIILFVISLTWVVIFRKHIGAEIVAFITLILISLYSISMKTEQANKHILIGTNLGVAIYALYYLAVVIIALLFLYGFFYLFMVIVNFQEILSNIASERVSIGWVLFLPGYALSMVLGGYIGLRLLINCRKKY